MQDLSSTGYFLLLAFAFFIIWTWIVGRMATSKLRNRIAKDLVGRFQSTTKKVSVKLLGNTGAKFSFHQKSDSPLPKLEATILLLDRSNFFHLLYCKVRHRTDQLQIRANLKESPSLRIELIKRDEKSRLLDALSGVADRLSEVTPEGLKDRFYIVTLDPDIAEQLFEIESLVIEFEAVAPYLTRLSIARREPHLFASVMLVPEAMDPTERFLFALAKALGRKRR